MSGEDEGAGDKSWFRQGRSSLHDPSAKEIARGAEALIEEINWLGQRAIRKRRIPKSYRNKKLDIELRKIRTRAEARLFRDARGAGFPTPHILDLDEEDGSIVMEFLDGPTAKTWMNENHEKAPGLCQIIGEFIGKLHSKNIAHGDLTTSNIMITEGGPVFIDLGLGSRGATDEELGVDLHLINEALESTHNHLPGLFDHILDGYRKTFPRAEDIERKMRDIEKRGRYT